LPGLSFPDASVGNDGTACCTAKLIIIDHLTIPYYYSYFCQGQNTAIIYKEKKMNPKNPVKTKIPDILIAKNIKLDEFSYSLPEEKIAQFPVNKRDMSKLLILKNNSISETLFCNIDEYIPGNHLLVFNNSRVVRARLHLKKKTGASIEVLCIEPLVPSGYERSFSSKDRVIWKCIIGNLKKWKSGKLIKPFNHDGRLFELTAERLNPQEDAFEIRFEWNCSDLTFAEVLEKTGHIPLPPYINREDKDEDATRYQTIYAQIKGSVAAPTAGLHFTDRVFEKLAKKGVIKSEVTLHVGAGTFQPIKSEEITDHEMHCEHFAITDKSIKKLLENEGRIIAVGTTSVRTLESLYWIGVKLLNRDYAESEIISLGQWEPYTLESSVSLKDSLRTLLEYMKKKEISSLNASTRIIIVPGYDFRITNAIITNFHQPGSTLLLLVAAWTGKKWKDIYEYALKNNFRFLSYGDCSLLFRSLKV
jgi:S-adenosylmethionine:tRNA ribosyltransferase-isomerase